MTDVMPILAAGGEDPTVKIIIGVVVAVFWVIAQVAGALGKKEDKSLPLPSEQPPQPRPPRQTPRPDRVPPVQRRQKPQPPRRQPPPIRQQPAYEAPPVARQRVMETVSEIERKASQSPAKPGSLPRRQMINALLRPQNLRRAFVVNELLQPPVALRGERE